jgi:ABC-type branched-subunit amino acid transport system ATPase component
MNPEYVIVVNEHMLSKNRTLALKGAKLIKRSGAGKTTTINLLTGLARPTPVFCCREYLSVPMRAVIMGGK